MLGPLIYYGHVLLHFNRPISILWPDFKFLSYTSTILPYLYNFIIKCLQSRPQISLNLMKTAVLNSFLKFYVMRRTEIDLYGIPYSLENNVALYSYYADRNSHYTRGRIILKVALYGLMSAHFLLKYSKFSHVYTVKYYINLSNIQFYVLSMYVVKAQSHRIRHVHFSRPKYTKYPALYKRSHYIEGCVI